MPTPKPSRSCDASNGHAASGNLPRDRSLAVTLAKWTERGIPSQLPLWPDLHRGLPNEMVRCSLFTVRSDRGSESRSGRGSPRRSFQEITLAATDQSLAITYSGEELRQDDAVVWTQLLHLFREASLSECVTFSPHAFLKAIRWGKHGPAYEHLYTCLARMQAGKLVLRTPRLGQNAIHVSLIRKFYWIGERVDPALFAPAQAQDDPNSCRVWLEPEILRLFGFDHFLWLPWQQHLELRSALSQWLHRFYCSHSNPGPFKVATLWQACGSSMTRQKHFRAALRKSLEELRRVGFLTSYRIDASDLVFVTRARQKGRASVGPASAV